MQPLCLTATTVVSAIGCGMTATAAALRSRRGGLRPCDFGDMADGYIGRVDALDTHRLPSTLRRFDCRNNCLADLALHTDGFASAVAVARHRYGADRIAVILGTSTSGILSGEQAYQARKPATAQLPEDFDYTHTHDMFSLADFVRSALDLHGPAMVVSTACASSARTFIDAYQMIASGMCDAAVVGGADSLCGMTLRGFASLDLISPVACRPCDAERDGISIGEAAGFALLEYEGSGPALLGCGASSDGHHMSAPHPGAVGAIASMRAALATGGLSADEIDYVNLHGTGTRANDAMEDIAMIEVFGAATPCSSTKGWTGHTLGACGILEALVACLCIEHRLMPGCLNVTALDPDFRARVLTDNEQGAVRRVMSNSFGFGGINCSLIFGTSVGE
jgi:3-oxoacyl-[acyl-carrier-protein] synthase I